MMAFPSMIAKAAKDAGMKVPLDPESFDSAEFPHFSVFCGVQLGRPIRWGEHWGNAKVIAAVPEDKIATITLQDLIDAGLEYQT